jgi:PAS domain S-box-containing protein
MEQGNHHHVLVRTDYTVRTAAFLWCLITIGLHLWDRGAGFAAWLFLVLQFAVYPHIAYLRAMHSDKPTRAELNNLLIDSLLLGAWCALLGFPTWISYMLVAATSLNAMVNRGAEGAVFALGCSAAGAALGAAIGGVHYAPATSTIVTTLCFSGSIVYACSVGYLVYLQNRRLSRARDEIRESQHRYQLITENAADLIALVDQDGRWHYASPSYANLLRPGDLEPGTDAFRRVHPDDAARARSAVLRSAATGKPRELSLRLVDREGRIRQFRMRVRAVGEAAPGNGHPQVILVSQDVTDLRDSEERLLLAAHALEGMTEAIIITAADGTVVTVNRAFSEITGYTRDEVLGQSFKAFRNALQPPEFYEEVYAVVQRDGYWSGTTWSRRKNGAVYREWRSLRAVKDAQGQITHYVSVFYEVTAQHPAQGRNASDFPQ